MAKALPAGRPVHRRAFFGLFDSDGWGWAFTKAFFWLLVIIMALGYVPDRAYYFIVSRTIDLGILGWSPVNLCPPENGAGVPCPVPAGGIVPWQDAAAALPQARTNGAAAQLGKNLLYIGGTDAIGGVPSATTFVSTVDAGNIGAWAEGPALPEGRADPGLTTLSGTAYLVGGLDPDGKPTNTVWSIGLDPDTSQLGVWGEVMDGDPAKKKDAAAVTLPEARSGAAVVAVTDGIVVAGGRGPDGKPTATVWKSTIDKDGFLQAFQEQPSLAFAVADASIALEGTYLWVYGGSDANGAVAGVQRADYGVASTATGSAAPGAPSAIPGTQAPAGETPAATTLTTTAPAESQPATSEPASPAPSAETAASAEPSPAPATAAATAAPPAATNAPGGSPSASGAPEGVQGWTVSDALNLPGPRTGASGFAANGALYVVGGSDGTSTKRELYWALPDATGNLPGGWRHLNETDLPQGIENAAVVTSGSSALLLGGDDGSAAVASSTKASLAPEEPFFRLGLVGLVVPGLQIGGEIGQQLGYLAAAGVGTGNFVILVAIGWAFNHRETIRGWLERRKARKDAEAPPPA
jgi:hypothetical protein